MGIRGLRGGSALSIHSHQLRSYRSLGQHVACMCLLSCAGLCVMPCFSGLCVMPCFSAILLHMFAACMWCHCAVLWLELFHPACGRSLVSCAGFLRQFLYCHCHSHRLGDGHATVYPAHRRPCKHVAAALCALNRWVHLILSYFRAHYCVVLLGPGPRSLVLHYYTPTPYCTVVSLVSLCCHCFAHHEPSSTRHMVWGGIGWQTIWVAPGALEVQGARQLSCTAGFACADSFA